MHLSGQGPQSHALTLLVHVHCLPWGVGHLFETFLVAV
uniref:Uncharacterized protein n=1 Tax=Utricularia reniformis TaxID=192314 RepID=A0A1Y0AZZ9_9LAMI|nr:hypothetical protein AEK19_MT0499 [Utricularia reniformis]ART30755.1 hypothetical protein AEK19_MT0499 [Utricularia reniformis]